MTCTHKTLRDHSSQVGTAPRRWRCSCCGKVDTWIDTWGYWGNIECKHCGMAAIDFVYCSEACKVALEKQHGIDPDAKPTRAKKTPKPKPRPAWERKAIAAGWTPPADVTPFSLADAAPKE